MPRKPGTEPAVAVPNEGKVEKERKKRRRRPRSVALREIRFFQMSTALLIPRRPMRRIIRAYMNSVKSDMRMTGGAAEAIQTVLEAYTVEQFKKMNDNVVFDRRSTIKPRDAERVERQTA